MASRATHAWPTSGESDGVVRIAVLGAGAWGTALAIAFHRSHEIRLWSRAGHGRDALIRDRQSPYLPGITVPQAITLDDDFSRAVGEADLLLAATPTSGLRETLEAVCRVRRDPDLLFACKGFEAATGALPHEVVADALPDARRVGALSGPSFADEVARGLPAALTIASADGAFASATASALNGPHLRLYSSTDLVGVELGGALKNVIAIAAGVADGLGLGRNARAALITRGLAEIARLGAALGGRPETFMGLTGLGDLALTCTGDLSRNRTVGLRLAKGEALTTILHSLGHVSEGVASAKAAAALASRHGIDMPITSAVCRVLFDGEAPARAVESLLARDPRGEAI